MQIAKKPIDGLADLARSRPETRDAALLRATTELFVHDPTHDRDEIRRYEELAAHLLAKVSIGDRIFVAERLADCDDAPQSVVRMLARDVIGAAEPVIRRSSVFAPLDLLAVIAATGVEHHRLIARRSGLADQVKRALFLTGDADVIGALDLEPPVRSHASEGGAASAALPAPLPPTGGPTTPDHRDPEAFLRLDRRARLKILADLATRPPPRRYAGSSSRLDQAFRSILGAARTVGFARTGQRGELIAAIADGLGLRQDIVAASLADATGEALAVMLKALRLDDVQAQQVLLLASAAGRDTATFFPVADLYAAMEPSVAEALCEMWRPTGGGEQPMHEPFLSGESDPRRVAVERQAGQTIPPEERARRA